VQVAFDGWPVELIDTAGLRAAEGLEAEGIERAKRVSREADLVVWVMDSCEAPVADTPGSLVVWNKSDLASTPAPGLSVSAKTGAGIPELVTEIVRRLVSDPPPPGAAVPFTPRLADLVEAAHVAVTERNVGAATRLLRDCLPAD
jgi:tRNA modification GTPase